MAVACKLPNVERRRHCAAIRACAELITSGLLLRMVAITSIDEFRALFNGDAEFAVIDPRPQADFAAWDKGKHQL